MGIIVKTFDCVEMKNRIQEDLYKEKEFLGDAEYARRKKEWLEMSDSPLAKWWRAATSGQHEDGNRVMQ